MAFVFQRIDGSRQPSLPAEQSCCSLPGMQFAEMDRPGEGIGERQEVAHGGLPPAHQARGSDASPSVLSQVVLGYKWVIIQVLLLALFLTQAWWFAHLRCTISFRSDHI